MGLCFKHYVTVHNIISYLPEKSSSHRRVRPQTPCNPLKKISISLHKKLTGQATDAEMQS